MHQESNEKTTYTLIPQHYNQKDIDGRKQRFDGMQTVHKVPIIDPTMLSDNRIELKTGECSQFTLQHILDSATELLPAQMKEILWQVVLYMLEAQRLRVNHYRLTPSSITLDPPSSHPLLIRIKNPSFGREFHTRDQGKHSPIFEYLHPTHSLRPHEADYDHYHPECDIWSVGVILYKLIYRKHPFRKKDKYSKSMLDKYQAGQYKLQCQQEKYRSLNVFIRQCLARPNHGEEGFKDWQDVCRYFLSEETKYVSIDLMASQFPHLLAIHNLLICTLSSVHTMIVEELQLSPFSFWRTHRGQEQRIQPIAQTVLYLIDHLHRRFLDRYRAYLSPQQLKQQQKTSQSIKEELAQKKRWLVSEFNPSQGAQGLAYRVDKLIECCGGALKETKRLYQQSLPAGPQSKYFSFGEEREKVVEEGRGVRRVAEMWRSVGVLELFCWQLSQILEQTKHQTMLFYDHIYRSKALRVLAWHDLGVPQSTELTAALELVRSRSLPDPLI